MIDTSWHFQEVLKHVSRETEIRHVIPLTALIDVRFDVPVSVYVSWVVLLDASRLNLLEPPLRKVDVASSKIAVQVNMLQTERCGQSTDARSVR